MTKKKSKNLPHFDAHLGEQFAEALDKIEPAVAQLHEATKTINEQVESFKGLSQAAQEQIKSSLKEATKTIAETVAKEITSATEKKIHEILQPLERSAQYALCALHDTKIRKRLRVTGFFCLSCLVVGLVGFCMGYIYGNKALVKSSSPSWVFKKTALFSSHRSHYQLYRVSY